MRQYLYIILQRKQADFQFKSTLRLLLESCNEDSNLGEKITYSKKLEIIFKTVMFV